MMKLQGFLVALMAALFVVGCPGSEPAKTTPPPPPAETPKPADQPPAGTPAPAETPAPEANTQG